MSSVMPQIRNVVHLMLENRSLDNLLGWLYANGSPSSYYPRPPDLPAPYNGLLPGVYFNPASSLTGVKRYPVVPIPDAHASAAVPAYDPYEAMREGSAWNGVMNQLFGDQTMIGGMPDHGQYAMMHGFLQDYYARYMVSWQGLDILWTYDAQQAPNINLLAQQYAVSDRWFCSVPTQTNPNRAYSLCGTSLGREANANLQAVEQYDVRTLFNALGEAGRSWGLYYEDVWQQGQCFTQYTFPQLSSAPHGEIAAMSQFFSRAQAGTLPAFTYLEPKWGYGKGSFYVQGHDYHPPTLIGPGEAFLASVFVALCNGPQWGNTLFVVTFDEHGGTYDHVAPPWGAINPDGIHGTKWGFDFQLYGARVPTLLISPYVAQGTVFREPTGSAHPYDHTSFIRTVLEWAGVDPASAGLGNRVPVAPRFDGVLSPTPVNTFHVAPGGIVDGKIVSASMAGAPVEVRAAAAPPSKEDLGPLGSPPPAERLDDGLFAGMPFASVRHILGAAETLADIHAGIARFKADPHAFESAVASGHTPP
ncbi:MAG TPA: alkaline phosphatase family protein [Kofleriaceae bacterium]|nr:alkaline phosphatase family protein [Kofleriaceae bacterium]